MIVLKTGIRDTKDEKASTQSRDPRYRIWNTILTSDKVTTKKMLPIAYKPAIQYIIEEAIASGIEEILIVTSITKRSIEDHFDKSYNLEDTIAKKVKQRCLRWCKTFQIWHKSTTSVKKKQKV